MSVTLEDAAKSFGKKIEELGEAAYDWFLKEKQHGVRDALALGLNSAAWGRVRRALEATDLTRTSIERLEKMLRQRGRELVAEAAKRKKAANAGGTRSRTGKPPLMVPGEHAGQVYVELADFAEAALTGLPSGGPTLYGRSGHLGYLTTEGPTGMPRFERAEIDWLRQLLDKTYTVGQWVGEFDAPVFRRRTPLADHARQLLSVIRTKPELVRQLRAISSFPCFARSPDGSLQLLKEGWNAAHGVLGAWRGLPKNWAPMRLDLASRRDRGFVKRRVKDLFHDFPLKNDASKTNALALALKIMLRTAVSVVPATGVVAPQPRTGKTLLACTLLGVLYLDHPLPTTAWPDSEQEVEKRLLGILLSAQPIAVIDNINSHLKSGSLAMLLTSPTFMGRVLGTTNATMVENLLTLIWTANNVSAHPEILKRSVPIELESKTEKPERRTEFAHPDLVGYVRQERPKLLAMLAGMVLAWQEAGSTPGQQILGGFEDYSRIIDGVLSAWGFDGWASNLDAWALGSSEDELDARALVEAWVTGATDGTFQMPLVGQPWERPMTAQNLADLCAEEELFQGLLARYRTDDRGKGRAQGMSWIMRSHLLDRQFGSYRVRRWVRGGRGRFYFLEKDGKTRDFSKPGNNGVKGLD